MSRYSFIKPPTMPLSKGGMSPDRGNTITDSNIVNQDIKTSILEDKNYQPESNTDSSVV